MTEWEEMGRSRREVERVRERGKISTEGGKGGWAWNNSLKRRAGTTVMWGAHGDYLTVRYPSTKQMIPQVNHYIWQKCSHDILRTSATLDKYHSFWLLNSWTPFLGHGTPNPANLEEKLSYFLPQKLKMPAILFPSLLGRYDYVT